MSKLSEALRHPVAIAAATALFSGIIATSVTRVWQNHDKSLDLQRARAEQEIELKSALVRDIGATSAGLLGAVVSVTDRPSLDSAYRAFTVDSARVASQLAAYFPASQAPVRWKNFSYVASQLYYVLTTRPGRSRDSLLRRLGSYLRVGNKGIDGLCFKADTAVYQTALRQTALRLQGREAQIVEEVVRNASTLTKKGSSRNSLGQQQKRMRPVSARAGTASGPCDAYFKH